MALNIQSYSRANNQPPLHYWNRTISKGDTLRDIGGIPTESIRDLAAACDMIWISVSAAFRHSAVEMN